MSSYRRKYIIPPPEKAVRTFGSRPGAKAEAIKARVEKRKRLRRSGAAIES
jgi:hypothetical protein